MICSELNFKGDLIRVDSSNCLYLISSQKPIQKVTEEKTSENENKTQSEKNQDVLFDYVKVGSISNVNGFSVLNEAYATENEEIHVKEMGSYKKLYIMKLIKLYVFCSLLSYYVVHFTGYKGEITVPNQDLHDLILKHH